MKIVKVPAIQDLAWCLGSDGCYTLCLMAIAEKITGKDIDVLKTTRKLIDSGLIDYDDKRPKAYKNAMYVKDADKVLKVLGCVGYHIIKVDELPKDYKGYYIIRYTLEGNTHFILKDYNSITYSRCVAEGRISKYYLVEKV